MNRSSWGFLDPMSCVRPVNLRGRKRRLWFGCFGEPLAPQGRQRGGAGGGRGRDSCAVRARVPGELVPTLATNVSPRFLDLKNGALSISEQPLDKHSGNLPNTLTTREKSEKEREKKKAQENVGLSERGNTTEEHSLEYEESRQLGNTHEQFGSGKRGRRMCCT